MRLTTGRPVRGTLPCDPTPLGRSHAEPMIQLTATTVSAPSDDRRTAPFCLELRLRGRDPRDLAEQLLLLAESVRQVGGVAAELRPTAVAGSVPS